MGRGTERRGTGQPKGKKGWGGTWGGEFGRGTGWGEWGEGKSTGSGSKEQGCQQGTPSCPSKLGTHTRSISLNLITSEVQGTADCRVGENYPKYYVLLVSVECPLRDIWSGRGEVLNLEPCFEPY